ncbi:hypothetical protein [Leptolyngbya sp. NIES-2104]|nr:hypothetical protein [Leptolyngbya sp. NIES-2104]GAP97371.1 hypothetical protein NIES2104_39180 [Leptolyngbya sp. NIES-2104]
MSQTLNEWNDRISRSHINAPNSPTFNFELWAKQLRPQLLASLNKRK